jgi:predicted transcriptional regulator
LATKREQARRRRSLRPHPTRDAIVDFMRSYGMPVSPTRIAEVLGPTLGSIAYHVRVLHEAGVVELTGEGRARGAVEHYYSLVADNKADLNDPLVGLQKLCGVLTLPTTDGAFPQPVGLDQSAREQMTNVLKEIQPRVRRIIEGAAARASLE